MIHMTKPSWTFSPFSTLYDSLTTSDGYLGFGGSHDVLLGTPAAAPQTRAQFPLEHTCTVRHDFQTLHIGKLSGSIMMDALEVALLPHALFMFAVVYG